MRGDAVARRWLRRKLSRDEARELILEYGGAGSNEADRHILRKKLGVSVSDLPLVDSVSAAAFNFAQRAAVGHVHPAFSAFRADWGVAPRACRPYRARTKGKTESGVGYVKRNAIAGRAFESFAALEAHLAAWMIAADTRIHGTTHERPLDRFEREERQALRALPARPLSQSRRRRQRRWWCRHASAPATARPGCASPRSRHRSGGSRRRGRRSADRPWCARASSRRVVCGVFVGLSASGVR